MNAQSDELEIQKLVETWMRATKVGDVETVLSLMTDDAVFLIPGQKPMVGKASFAAAFKRPINQPTQTIEGTSEIQEIQVEGNMAFMWTNLKVVVTPAGEGSPIVRAGNTLSVLRKEEGRWVLARDANLLTAVTDATVPVG